MESVENTKEEFPTEIPIDEKAAVKAIKKRRGRPKGSKNKVHKPKKAEKIVGEEIPPNEVEFDLLENKNEVTDIFTTNSIKYVFNILSIVLNNDVWKISDKEAKEIFKGFADVAAKLPKSKVNKYKKYFDNYTPFIQLAIILSAVIYPRYVATQYAKELDQYKSDSNLDRETDQFNRNTTAEGYQGFANEPITDSSDTSGIPNRDKSNPNAWFKEYGSR